MRSKKTILTLLVLALVFAFVGAIVAQEVQSYRGTVKSVDAGANSLVVTSRDGTEKTFAITDRTTVDVGDKKKLADIAANDKVIVEYAERDGQLRARSVKAP